MTDSKKEPAPVVAPAEAKPVAAAPKPEPAPAPAPVAEKPKPKPEPAVTPEPPAKVESATPGRGAQVILDGAAQTAARGGAAPDMAGNLAVKEALEGSGEVADGTTPDGSTLTGKPAPDVAV